MYILLFAVLHINFCYNPGVSIDVACFLIIWVLGVVVYFVIKKINIVKRKETETRRTKG